MQCYTELVPPSGVTHALSVSFTSPAANNLVVARTSLLQIFSQKPVNGGQDAKLVFVAEYRLSATITSLGKVKVLNSKSGGEAVLVAFRDAKLSLIEWDPKQYSVSTVSIHYYENDDLLKCPWSPDLRDCVSHLTVDPSSRCAAFNFGVGNLAIIPFHQLGDDLVMEDEEDELGADTQTNGHSTGQINGHKTPYAASFVLPLTVLDPSLLHPVHLTFLHEYREPTIGVLYSTASRSSNLQYERKDVTIYAVFSLDLEQKASTTLQSIPRLPNDLHKIISLPLPVGGALVVGGNELIHIDQGGKTSGIAVNEFAKQDSSFAMADHSDLRLRLEGCQIEPMGNAVGDMLVTLATAEVAVLSFRLDGRSVAGLTLSLVSKRYTQEIVQSRASCIVALGSGRLFIGSEESDSSLLGTTKKTSQLKKSGSRAQLQANSVEEHDEEDEELLQEEEDPDDDDDDDDDDDLYGEAVTHADTTTNGESSTVLGSSFRLLDRLPVYAPLKDVVPGRKRKRPADSNDGTSGQSSLLDLALASGSNRGGGVTFFSRQLDLEKNVAEKIPDLAGLWSFPVKRQRASKKGAVLEDPYDNHLILSKRKADGSGESKLFSISDGEIEPKEGTEFELAEGATVEIGSVLNGSHTIQVLESEVRVYDSVFGLAQIWPINDEDSGSEARAVRATFSDPFVAIVRDDSTLLLLKADKSGELDEVELPDRFANSTFVTASLYQDNDDFFDTKRFYTKTRGSNHSQALLLLLDTVGSLNILSLPNVAVSVFAYDGTSFLPPLLAHDMPIPKHWRNKDSIVEALLANLGDQSHPTPYLIIKTESDDLAMYEAYPVTGSVGTFQFRKAESRYIAPADTQIDEASEVPSPRSRPASMRALGNVHGFSTVVVMGSSSAIVMKAASSAPRVHSLRECHIKAISGFHDPGHFHGLMYLDHQSQIYRAKLPPATDFGSSEWLTQKVELGQDVDHITYFDRSESYVLTTGQSIDFQLPQDDEWHSDWQDENPGFPPQVAQSSLHLLNAKSHHIISSYTFDVAEKAMCVKCMNLEVSEETHQRKDLIVVGTALVKGEEVPIRGCLYIFDVVDVVPEPDVPETDLRLKLVAKEEVRGAVTAISAVGSQGFVLAAQGQKCMVRGLKEDNTILPVAFMDMRYYVHAVKSLKGTGLCILGDAMSGLWLMGYSEEPYKMTLIGRDQQDLDVVTAEFLPDGKQLYIVSSDGDGQLHIMQYDPENPKSERGMKLLHRSSFHTGSFPTTMTLLPRTPVSSETPIQSADAMAIDTPSSSTTSQILLTTQEGSLALITPLSDAVYRRLSTLQNILTTQLDHPCSLNPRAYRAVETDGVGGRGMIEGNIILKWLHQSSQHKASTAAKAGGTVWEVRGDLEAIAGGGLGFL